MAALYARLVKEHVIAPAIGRALRTATCEQELRHWITGRYAGLYYWTSAIGKLTETLEPGQKMCLRLISCGRARAMRACSTGRA